MTEKEPDGEIDPAMERVRRKLVRLLMVSSGVMALGFAAVLIAVLYRISREDAPAPAEPVALGLPAADIRAATVSGDALVLTLGGATPRIEVRRLSDGALLNTFTLQD